MVYPDNQAVNEHFENLKAQYADTVNKARLLCDEAVDSSHFIQLSGNYRHRYCVLILLEILSS
jgi:vinculin